MLFSCTSDDLENNSTNPVINQLRNDLKLDQFANKNISENLVVNWETFSRIEKEGFEIYEIEANEKHISKIESNLLQSKLKYELIAIKKENEIHSYLVEVYSNLNYASFSNSIQNLKNFTGTLNVYELDGTLINQLVVYNGKSTNPSHNNLLTQLNEAINLFSSHNNLTSKVPECTLLQFVNILVNNRIDYYSYVTVGTYTAKTLQYSIYETYYIKEYMSVPCGGSEDSYINHYITTERNVESDPCKDLKTQNDDPNYKAKIDTLKGKTALKKETGFVQKKDRTYQELINNGNDSMNFPNDKATIGYMHTHLDAYPSGKYNDDGESIINIPIKIFSPADVKSFILLLVNAHNNNIPLSDIYGIMVSSSANYILKFEGTYSNINLGLNFDGLNQKYLKAITKNKEEVGFLKFLKDDMGMNGISLYKINSDDTYAKKTLDINNKLVTTPCQ